MEADRPAPWGKPPLLRSPPSPGGRSRDLHPGLSEEAPGQAPPEALSSVPGAGKPQECSCSTPSCFGLSPGPTLQPLLLLGPPPSPRDQVVHKWGLVARSLLLTSFKLEMRPEEELERPKRFSIVVRLLLK